MARLLRDSWLAGHLAAHGHALWLALAGMWRHKASSALGIVVMALTLTLAALFYSGSTQLKSVGASWGLQGKISLYLRLDSSAEQAQQLQAKLQQRDDIVAVNYISRQQSLQFFKRHSGFGEALQELDSNPLPAVLEVEPRVEIGLTGEEPSLADDSQLFSKLRAELANIDIVETAAVDILWIKRLAAILQSVERALYIITSILLISVILTIGNTIHVDIQSNARAIAVQKLVGATNAFIMRPFLYSGLLYGLFGGLLALLLANVALLSLGSSIAAVAKLYASDLRLQQLGFAVSCYLLITSTLLGLCGAWLALWRHLRDIELSN